MRYNVPDQYTFLVHAYVFIVVFAAIGVDHWLGRFPSAPMRVAVVALSLTGPVVYAMAPMLLRDAAWTQRFMPARDVPYRDSYTWLLRPWRAGYHGAERYAREVFEVLPPDAVLLAGDTVRRPLVYLQIRDGVRPDVRISTGRRDPLGRQAVVMTPADALDYAGRGRLFSTGRNAGYAPSWLFQDGYRFEPIGHVYRVRAAEPERR
jgi:hypothetical protein